MIFAYQFLHGNVHVNLSWDWTTPLSQIDGAAAGVRGNNYARLALGTVVHDESRANFLGVRLATPLNSLPADIMSILPADVPSVNNFKNAYDALFS
jgi:hypothetical protein